MSFRIISGGFELLSMVDKIADSGLVGEGIVLVVLEQAQVRFEQRAKFSVVDDYFLFKNIPQSSLVLHVVILIYRLVSGEQRCGLFAQVVEGTERLSENAINGTIWARSAMSPLLMNRSARQSGFMHLPADSAQSLRSTYAEIGFLLVFDTFRPRFDLFD